MKAVIVQLGRRNDAWSGSWKKTGADAVTRPLMDYIELCLSWFIIITIDQYSKFEGEKYLCSTIKWYESIKTLDMNKVPKKYFESSNLKDTVEDKTFPKG